VSARDVFIAFRAKHPLGQFGQAHSVATFNGSTACGPTSSQSIIGAIKRVIPTLDAICRVMGYWRPADRRGTSAEQNAKALGKWHLSYRAAYGLSLLQLRALAHKGPVMLVVQYHVYPGWKGYRGHPRPTPWSQPYGKSGANQYPLPRFLHWVVLAGPAMTVGPYKGLLPVMEPNHDSPARPENVVIDYITPAALEAAYGAAGKRIAVVPNRSV
jgi:hypothetical protein